MTLIVGVRCTDGVVMGADGAATFGGLGNFTIRQPTKKLTIVDNCIIVGVSGSVGLGQRIIGEIESEWNKQKPKPPSTTPTKKPLTYMKTSLADAFRKHVEPEIKAAILSKDLVGVQAAQSSAICHSMLATPLVPQGSEVCLITFDHQCASEEIKWPLPFVAIGSGQSVADPFLAFLRKIFWQDTQPNIADGTLAVYWALSHAIETAPGFVAGDIQVAVLESKADGATAKVLDERELEEHKYNVSDAEKVLREWCARQRDRTPPQNVPEPPTPP